MIIYLLLALFCVFLSHFPKYKIKISATREIDSKEVYFIIIAAILISFCGLRGTSVGTDTWNYTQDYYHSYHDFFELVSEFSDRLGLAFWKTRGDLGYTFITSLFNGAGLPFNVLLIFTSALLIIPTSVLIYRYSTNAGLSYFWFIVLIMGIAMSGIRSSMAWGITIIAFLKLQKGKKLQFWLLMVPAVLIHLTAIVFVFYYFVRNIKLTPIKLLLILITSILIIRFNTYIGEAVNRYTYVDYIPFSIQEANIKLFIFFITTTVLALAVGKNDTELNRFALILSLSIVIFGIFSAGSTNRVLYYFSIYSIIVIPNMLAKIKDPKIRIIGHCVFFSIGIYLIARYYTGTNNLVPYVFFWQ